METDCRPRCGIRAPGGLLAAGAILISGLLCASETPDGGFRRVAELEAVMEKLRPLHRKLGKPAPGDWLWSHRETGQTFSGYVGCDPVTPRGERSVVYIQPVGNFSETQRRIISRTAEFIGLYFNLRVRVQKDLPLSLIPASARRRHPSWGMEQVLTGHVLENILKPALPEDAAASLALTTSDLWPGEGWNFVFGQASLRDRVGVWSIFRNGDPQESDQSYRLCLLRTMKTAVHEIGHMFSMLHCTLYECGMCGSNHREESDRRPLALCPECVAKVCWATDADPIERYRKLAAFCRECGFEDERRFYERSLSALTAGRRKWAERLNVPGVPNLHRVSSDLYRGAQPTADGMRRLKEMGVKTVVNLRSFHSDRDEIGDTGLAYEHITMKAWHAEDKEIVRFLQIVADRSRAPLFVHCQHGADRTGFMCAVYRVAVCGWDMDEAVREMVDGGFGYHAVWKNLIDGLESLDIEALKRRAKLR